MISLRISLTKLILKKWRIAIKSIRKELKKIAGSERRRGKRVEEKEEKGMKEEKVLGTKERSRKEKRKSMGGGTKTSSWKRS